MRLFGWLTRRRGEDEPEKEWWERLSQLEHEMEQLQLSWEETYGKIRRALANIARRQKIEEMDSSTPISTGEGNGGSGLGPISVLEAHRRLGR